MTKQDLFQSVQQSQPLLAQRREVASNATKGGSSGDTAKAAGDLLLHFDHAQVSFSQIIVKGTAKLCKKVSTASCSLLRRSSRLRAALCLRRPLTRSGGLNSRG